ncbi:hypothetical protein [Adhaeribacter pallidiroseus]|uniref:Uncharacterized protein n=1 Tax=Adhaeribacter pallidiroseus TaxID=2072847 RepID=A0A369QQM3_9BACT|nr:hypothetical protein [Adhaeribacter pallidiroseus]RDC65527.1 hypothetical protein AHMF7616_04157 [Adhaeribacter pallidiroseus]
MAVNDRKSIVAEVSRILQKKYSRYGLAEFLNKRFGIDIDPDEIRHKGAFLEVLLLDLTEDQLYQLAKDLGLDSEIDRKAPTPSMQVKDFNAEKQDEPPVDSQQPSTWIGFAFWVASSKKRLVISLLAAIFLGILLIGTGRVLGYDVFASLFPRLVKVRVSQFNDPGLQSCIDEARKRGKAYVILAATQLVELRFQPEQNPRTRMATVRMVYTLLMLKDVSQSENTEFFEAFTSDNRARIERWYGSERETADASGSSYDVIFDAKAGETRTVITGATYIDELPLPQNRSAFGQNTSLAENEDTWGYPNVIDGDIIREFTIVLWSPTNRIVPVGQAAKRLTNRTVRGADVNISESPRGGEFSTRSLSAKWYNLFPGEEVGIQFAW